MKTPIEKAIEIINHKVLIAENQEIKIELQKLESEIKDLISYEMEIIKLAYCQGYINPSSANEYFENQFGFTLVMNSDKYNNGGC